MAAKRTTLTELDRRVAAPDLWDDPDRARDVMRRHRRVKDEVDLWSELDMQADDVVGLIEFLDPNDSDLQLEIAGEVSTLETRLASLEFQLLLGDEYDEHDAFLTVQSGAGGTESQDWPRCCCACTPAGPTATPSRPTS